MAKTLRRAEPDPEIVILQHLLSSQGYFNERMPSHGIFDDLTHEKVVLFQLQHIDQTGNPLEADGVVGKNSWWALKHPSGDTQRNHFQPLIPAKLTHKRQQLLNLLYNEHAKPVFEVPDGSNRSPDIDGYWGDTGVKGYPWCCAFVSWAMQELLGVYPIGNKHHLGVQKMWINARQLDMEALHPKPGDIFIQIKSGGKGHTGFISGVSTDEKHIYTVEGNCGNRLKAGKRHIDSINHFIDCLQDGQLTDFEKMDLDIHSVDSSGTR